MHDSKLVVVLKVSSS